MQQILTVLSVTFMIMKKTVLIIILLNLFISVRAYHYCVTCHENVESPELVKECECFKGIDLQLL